jgi:hypothetical protein
MLTKTSENFEIYVFIDSQEAQLKTLDVALKR